MLVNGQDEKKVEVRCIIHIFKLKCSEAFPFLCRSRCMYETIQNEGAGAGDRDRLKHAKASENKCGA